MIFFQPSEVLRVPEQSIKNQNRLMVIGVLIAAVILTLAVAFQARQRMIKKEQTHSTAQVNDFDRWMVVVPEFLHQRINYTSDSFPTPPITLLLFAPLTFLSPANAQFVWVCCKLPFCLVIFGALWKLVDRAGVRLGTVSLLLVLAVWLWPVLGDMQEGQTNLAMLLPLATGLSLAQLEGVTWQWLAGILIALAICIKVTPLIFLIYFLWKRRGHISAAIFAGLGLWLFLVPALAFGWRQNMLWLTQWTRIMILPYLTQGRVEYFVGQSVPSFLSRLLRHVPAFHYHASGSRRWHYMYVNIFNLPAAVSDWIIRGFLAAIGVLGLWWSRNKLPSLKTRRYVLEIGAVAVFELWASPRTWVPHYVTLAMTLFATAMILCDSAAPEKLRRRAFGALTLAALLMFLTSDVGKIFGHNGHRWLLTIGVSLWATVLLVWTIFTAGMALEPAGEDGHPGPQNLSTGQDARAA